MTSKLDRALTRHLDQLAEEAPALDHELVSSARRRGERLRTRRALSIVGGSTFALAIAATTAVSTPWQGTDPGHDRTTASDHPTAATDTQGPETVGSIPMPEPPNGAVREVEHYETIEEAAQAANLSMLGTVTSVQRGKVFTDSDGTEVMRDQFLVINIHVDQVLTGRVNDGTSDLRMEVGPFPAGDLDLADYQDLVGRQSIYLLRLKGSGIPGVMPADPQELARNAYRVVNSQGMFDQAPDGTVRAPWTDHPLNGVEFADLVAHIDAAG